MNFYGLFIGIDRYASPNINELNCARRDAGAFYALFFDNFDGSTLFLKDKEATRSRIKQEFESLRQCKEEDFVVIMFSGHGTTTQQLVTYDTEPHDLDSTSIPLIELTEWFSYIPSKNLVFFLDCCFSGGVGTKVLQLDIKAKNSTATEDALSQLSGEGRFVFTASAANEEAWESGKHGHGLFTYYLTKALQGEEEVVESEKISFYLLVNHVTKSVADAALNFGKKQTPTFRGKVDGEITWPVFERGEKFKEIFPEYSDIEITEDIMSLQNYGFPSSVLSAWSGSIKKLNQLQLDSINNFGLLKGEHVIVSAPTSSGKTMIGELATLKGALERKKAIFLFPLKALVNDKHQHFNSTYASLGIRTIKATGDSSDDVPLLIKGRYDICLMTYEKFTALVLGNPHILEQIGTVVIDEVQMITDFSRGMNLEFIMTLLCVRRKQGIEPQLIALSAVIGDSNGLERWLCARLLCREERPVPLNEGILLANGNFRYIDSESQNEQLIARHIQPIFLKGSSQDLIIPLVQKLVSEGKQVIVFRETKGEARGTASYLAKNLHLPPANSVLANLPAGDPSNSSQILKDTLQKGIAFHISDLERDERLAIEKSFCEPQSEIRVISATTTLAMGVNTPAEVVVIAGLMHPGSKPYSVAEYKNIIGRAGRLGLAEKGTSYLLATKVNEEAYYWSNYVNGSPENLKSKFFEKHIDLRTLIVRIIAFGQKISGEGLPPEDVVNFLKSSFGAFRKSHIEEALLYENLSNLEKHQLITHAEGKYQLTELGTLAGEGIVEIESVICIINALSSINEIQVTDPVLIATAQLTIELDQVFFPLNKKSTKKEPQAWKKIIANQGIPDHISRMLETLRAKKTVACLFWITKTPLVDIENFLMKFDRNNDAAGAIRSVVSRTFDVLPVVMDIAELIHPNLDLASRKSRLLTRLEVGIPSSMIPLAMEIGTGFTRGDYLSLLGENLCTVEDLKNVPEETLQKCLKSVGKLKKIRNFLENHEKRKENSTKVTTLPKYEG